MILTEVPCNLLYCQFLDCCFTYTDVPLLGNAIKSRDVISKSVDMAMDRAQPASNGAVGISIRNGPVEEMDIEQPKVNGHSSTKRKARASTSKSYREDSDGSEDAPLVRDVTHFTTSSQI